MLGGIEAGGTKFVCVVGSGPGEVLASQRFPTGDPGTTIATAIAFFGENGPVEAIGIASFGPLELRHDHPSFGFITSTPKAGWAHTDLAGAVRRGLGLPVEIDTDVNAAALAEWRWGAGQGVGDMIYLTVGTGIGGGAISSGRIVHGLVHPEMGHLAIPREPDDSYAGGCPYHGACWEGLASGPALEARWGRRGEVLAELAGAAIDLEARYLAAGLRNLIYTLAPERIVIGGGLSELPGLFVALRNRLSQALAGYPGLTEHSDDGFVVPPGLGGRSGSFGALALADRARRRVV